MDADDEATWTYSRRVPAWARPFRGAPHVREQQAPAVSGQEMVGIGEAVVAQDGVAALEGQRVREHRAVAHASVELAVLAAGVDTGRQVGQQVLVEVAPGEAGVQL